MPLARWDGGGLLAKMLTSLAFFGSLDAGFPKWTSFWFVQGKPRDVPKFSSINQHIMIICPSGQAESESGEQASCKGGEGELRN